MPLTPDTRFRSFDQIERLELGKLRHGPHAPPQWIELQLTPGEVIFMPDHGWDPELLLKPLREFIGAGAPADSAAGP